jgi:hypothetical protein
MPLRKTDPKARWLTHPAERLQRGAILSAWQGFSQGAGEGDAGFWRKRKIAIGLSFALLKDVLWAVGPMQGSLGIPHV